MSLEKEKYINKILQLLPEGVVAPSSWFAQNGISAQLLHKYAQNEWLEKLERSAYIKKNCVPSWQGAVLGLTSFEHKPFHIGGITALNLQGYAHYLPIGAQNIHLYGTDNPPFWIANLKLQESLVFHKKPDFKQKGLKEYQTSIRNLNIPISSPERAILELLYLTEKGGFSFEFIGEIFEGLTNLRPDLLNELLTACDNIKIKRLFLFFSNHYKHPWSKYIETDNLSLGSGKLQIAKDGKLDKTYLITIPKGLSNAT